MDVIFTIGIFLAFFLSLLLFTKKYKTLPDKLLAIWLIVIGSHLLGFFLYSKAYWDIYPHLIGLTVPLPFLYGPLLFLYVKCSLRSDPKLPAQDFLHFLPVVFTFLYLSPFYFLYPPEEKIMVFKEQVDDFSVFSTLVLFGYILSGLFYTFYSYRKLNQHQKLVDSNFSFDERISLEWLKYFIWGIGLLFLTVALVQFLREVPDVKFPFDPDFVFYSVIIALVFYIGFFGIRQQNIFSNQWLKDERNCVRVKAPGEYRKSGLKEDTAREKHEELLRVMEEKKPFLNPGLTLGELSEIIDISPNYLSQIINQSEKVNFHDFINKYRVEEFISRAKNNQNFSILALAFDAGFNSKSSFNTVFKKHMEMTPSRFMAGMDNEK